MSLLVTSRARRLTSQLQKWVCLRPSSSWRKKKSVFLPWKQTSPSGSRSTWRRAPWDSLQWMLLPLLQHRGTVKHEIRLLLNWWCKGIDVQYYMEHKQLVFLSEIQPSSIIHPDIQQTAASTKTSLYPVTDSRRWRAGTPGFTAPSVCVPFRNVKSWMCFMFSGFVYFTLSSWRRTLWSKCCSSAPNGSKAG